jgi:oligopeptide/dipeptide ABC transporter ATP-binding protein
VSGLDPVLEVRDVAVHFAPRGGWFGRPPPVKAVDGVDLTIGAGETLSLVGESGCGKSTLSNAIVGLVRPTRGSICIRGREIAGATRNTLHAVRRHVQMVFQDPALSLNPRARIGAAIAEPLIVRGIARGKALEERVETLLAQVGLRAEHAGRYPHQFSGGQRQRIVIARALALEPALLVCDEPVSALDVSVRAQILNLLVDLQRRMGVSYLFVSHDLSVVQHISDRVAVMYLGRIVEQAPRDVFFAAPKHPYAQALMSAVPEANPIVQRAKRRLVLSGELPSPTKVPPGCPFHTRCPLMTAICARERPVLTPRPDGALVACHHA